MTASAAWLVSRVILDAVVGPATGLDAPVAGAMYRLDRAPAIAAAPGGWIALWEHAGPRGTELRAGALAPDGALVDPMGFFLGDGRRPAIACGPQGCLAVWSGTPFEGSNGPPPIYAARLDATGLYAAPLDVGLTGESPAVAWQPDEGTFLVVGQGAAARVAADGLLLDDPSIQMDAGVQDAGVSSAPGGWIVVWAEAGRVRAQPVSGDAAVGAAIDVSPIASAELAQVATDGASAAIVWSDAFQSRIRLARATVDAGAQSIAVLDTVPIDLTDNARWRIAPAVVASEGGWLVVWTDACDSFVASMRVAADGVPIDPAAVTLSTTRTYWDGSARTGRPGVAIAAGVPIVAYAGQLPGAAPQDGYHTIATRLSGGLPQDDPALLLGSGPNEQGAPSLFAIPELAIGAWMDYRNGEDADLWVNTAAAPSTSDPVPIAVAPGSQGSPVVARVGDAWLFVWDDGRDGPQTDVRGALRSGTVTTDLVIASGAGSQHAIAAALLGDGAIVVWSEGDLLRATPIRAEPDPVGDPVTIGPGTGVSAIGHSAGALVVWTVADGDVQAVRASRVALDGSLLDADPIHVATAGELPGTTAVSWDGRDYLVVWSEIGAFDADVHAVRVSSTGEVLGAPREVGATLGVQMLPAAAHDGFKHVVVWRHGEPRLHGLVGVAWISDEGEPAGDAILDVRLEPEEAPSLACRPNGSCILGTLEVDLDLGVGRAAARTLTSEPLDPDPAPDGGLTGGGPDASSAAGGGGGGGCGCAATGRERRRAGGAGALGLVVCVLVYHQLSMRRRMRVHS